MARQTINIVLTKLRFVEIRTAIDPVHIYSSQIVWNSFTLDGDLKEFIAFSLDVLKANRMRSVGRKLKLKHEKTVRIDGFRPIYREVKLK